MMLQIMKSGKLSLVVAAGLAAVGCGGSDGTNGQDGQDGVTTRIVELAPGSVCASGGIEVGLGIDADADGTLSDAEVTETKVVCNGENGADGVDGADGQDGVDGQDGISSLINVAIEPAGANCEAGGYRLDSGLDNGDGGATAGDGVLDAGEVDTTSYVCHGVDGFTVLTTLTAGVSASCPNGGQRLDIGLDNGDSLGTPHDGTLQSGEIDSTGYICNGSDGADGEDGQDGSDGSDGTNGSDGVDGTDGTNGTDGADGQTTLIKQAMASTANCPDGGVTITSGLDNGEGGGTANNATLENGEVDYTQHVCNGSAGGGNQLVDDNGAVLGSVLSAGVRNLSIRTPNNYLVTINWDGSFADDAASYGGSACTGALYIYIGGNESKIGASAAFWSSIDGGFLVPSNPSGLSAVESQVFPYESYSENGVCTAYSSTTEYLWPATLLSASTIGLPATIVPPLTLQ
ncbi:DUF7151 family protein [Alcanivorax profundi]|uniref:DUF7151 family protein n=1 Tax=Alcanivorax profundi TaxID=2338368 RepID=UPI002440CA14